MSASSLQCREVLYSGHVQGVGFRFTTEQIASRFQVVGYVRNLADGSVQLVAEGSPSELDRFLDAIAARMSSYIRESKVDVRPATAKFSEFSIRH